MRVIIMINRATQPVKIKPGKLIRVGQTIPWQVRMPVLPYGDADLPVLMAVLPLCKCWLRA